jgi:histidinol phosphatase-like PHP family hydrolase
MFGITDHANYNIPSYWENMKESKRLYEQYKTDGFYFGVELTTIPKAMYDHCAKTGTRDGYACTVPIEGYEFEFMLTTEDMKELGIMYAVAAAHSPWHTDVSLGNGLIKEWHRQQMYIATDPRVDILGHPWWFYYQDQAPWFQDFDVIPRSMHDELAAALIENGVCIEANAYMVYGERSSEDFYRKYNEYLRYMFEKGVKMTFGSDCHGPKYKDSREEIQKALEAVGFKKGDFTIPRIRKQG